MKLSDFSLKLWGFLASGLLVSCSSDSPPGSNEGSAGQGSAEGGAVTTGGAGTAGSATAGGGGGDGDGGDGSGQGGSGGTSGGGDDGGSAGMGTGGSSSGAHPGDAVQFNGHWYRHTTATIDAAAAQGICSGLGGYLVCIESQPEDAFVLTLAGTTRPWMGMNNLKDVNHYEWINGSPVTYTHWQPGQPDNPANERWVKMVADGTWDDGNIDTSYICEWDD
ncbi:lectin-like protein [Sorangium sp. So ce448]|uniref:lectin-like protein n=1 Tax=Sorangium sp. So ce448 TaxID=3133314 RepID=UPI003F5E6930